MHLAPHHSAARVIARAGLLALLAVMASSLTQCVQVTDPITGSTVAMFAKSSTGDCYTACARTFTDALKAEDDLWKSNKQSCGHDDVCLAVERARHDHAVDVIKAAFQACRENCHHQGRGSGGGDN